MPGEIAVLLDAEKGMVQAPELWRIDKTRGDFLFKAVAVMSGVCRVRKGFWKTWWWLICCPLLLFSLCGAAFGAPVAAQDFTLLAAGKGWRKVSFASSVEKRALAHAMSAKDQSALSEPFYVLVSGVYLKELPISGAAKSELKGLAAGGADGDSLIVLSAGIAETLTNTDRDEKLLKRFLAYSEAGDVKRPSATAGIVTCSPNWQHRSRDFQAHLTKSGDFKAESVVTVGINAGMGMDGRLDYSYKRTKYGCIPWAFRVRGASFSSSAGLSTSVTFDAFNGEIRKSFDYSLIPSVKLVNLLFFVGPIPVYVFSDFDVSAVGDLSLRGRASVGLQKVVNLNLQFGYVCTNSCRKSSFDPGVTLSGPASGGEARADFSASVIPHIQPSIGFGLYDPHVLRGAVGADLSLPVRIGMFASDNCSGKGAGDAYADITARLAFFLKMSLLDQATFLDILGPYVPSWGQRPLIFGWEPQEALDQRIPGVNQGLWSVARNLYFHSEKLPGVQASAFEPTVPSPQTVVDYDSGNPPANGRVTMSMRSCYPFSEAVVYQISWDGTSSERLTGSPRSLLAKPPPQLSGAQRVTVRVDRDVLGRRWPSAGATAVIQLIPVPVSTGGGGGRVPPIRLPGSAEPDKPGKPSPWVP